jgi:CubicO group peptidase (beta-lactamase class C family)
MQLRRGVRYGSIPLIALVALAVNGNVAAQNPVQDLDGYIKRSIGEWQLPGLGVAVVKDDQVVFLGTYGVRQLGREAPIDTQTLFPLGSLTKAFTALAVGILVDEGKLSWDDRVTKYLPWLQLADPWVTRNVTIRDLLSHRVADGWGGGSAAAGGSSYPFVLLTGFSHDESLRRMQYLGGPGDGFRSRFEYDNANYWAAGAVVAAVAGMSWQDFVRLRIFEPLGMRSARTDANALWDRKAIIPCVECSLADHTVSLDDARVENIAVPHRFGDDRVSTAPIYAAEHDPSGSIWASIADAAKWVRLQVGRGQIDGTQLLRPQTFAQMHTPQVSMPADSKLGPGNVRTYGFGWNVTTYRGEKAVMHGGGFATYIGLLPERRLGVVVLGNMPSLFREGLVLRIFDAYLGPPIRDWSTALLGEARQARERGRKMRATLAAAQPPDDERPGPNATYVGVYTHLAFGDVAVEEVGGQLVLSFVRGQVGDLDGWGRDTFRVNWRSPNHYRTFVTFRLKEGAVPSLTLEYPSATFRRTQ